MGWFLEVSIRRWAYGVGLTGLNNLDNSDAGGCVHGDGVMGLGYSNEHELAPTNGLASPESDEG